MKLYTDEEIQESWKLLKECEHEWIDEPSDSPFYKTCPKCGGAEGIRLPDWVFPE